ncbi:hypothetical protein F5Y13DRAFT_151922 [Hypoxylon sp. FL1857]|nr:hypothetical protein F5Y13DRAFT_151922 [Hypoxylon sp. FL1857]
MSRLGGPSLSHVLPSRTPTPNRLLPTASRRRHRPRRPWPSKKPVPEPMRSRPIPFEASALVLDLDAEDNRYVRPYKEDVDGVPVSSLYSRARRLKPIEWRVFKFEEESGRHAKFFRTSARNKFSLWQVSNYDILSVALQGLPPKDAPENASVDNEDESIKKWNGIFKKNGIPFHVRDNSSMAVAYMLRRQHLGQRLEPNVHNGRYFVRAIRGCNTFWRLERFIENAIQTPEGPQLISDSMLLITRLASRKLKRTSPSEVLPLLNNIIIMLEYRGLRVPRNVYYSAYLLALKSRAFPTAQKYLLKIFQRLDNRTLNELLIWKTLRILPKVIATKGPENTVPSTIQDTMPRLLAIYSLLTGHVLGEEMRQASLHDVIYKCRSSCLYLYVYHLAQLGCFRTMWYIWHEETGGAAPNIQVITRERPQPRSKTWIFLNAMQEALRTNTRLLELAQAPDFIHTANQFNEDHRLDMENIIKSADIISTRNSGQVYPSGNWDMYNIWGKVSIRESMLALQSYLNEMKASYANNDEASSPTQDQ